jgi:protease-4
MSLPADALIDRMKLKSEVSKWKNLAILFAVLFSIGLLAKVFQGFDFDKESYIARVHVSGVIMQDYTRDRRLESIKDNKNVKAVIVHVNSPGGTIVGGEHVYNSLRDIAEEKPVVAVLGTLATSAGYMAAIASDHIFTSAGTMTGSIGVMVQTAEATDLAKNVGVSFETIKSGKLKGSPSPVEKLTPEVRKVLEDGIEDGYDYFTGLVIDRRPLNKDEVHKLADGRIYTGRQAFENKLVDAIGDEDDAVDWLVKEKGLSDKLEVKTMKIKNSKTPLQVLLTGALGEDNPYLSQFMPISGFVSMWKQ